SAHLSLDEERISHGPTGPFFFFTICFSRRSQWSLGMKLFWPALAILALAIRPPSAAAQLPLRLEVKIPLGSVSGRIDHMAVDLARQRLFVAELGNDSVGVVNLAKGTVAHRITGLKEPQGVGYVASTDALLVANAGDGSVRLFRGDDFAPAGSIALGD